MGTAYIQYIQYNNLQVRSAQKIENYLPTWLYAPVRLVPAIACSPVDAGQMTKRHDRPTADYRDRTELKLKIDY